MEDLIRKRGTVKARLTNFSKFVARLETGFADKNVTVENPLLELEQRLQRTQLLIDEFESIQLEIDLVCTDSEAQDIIRESFEASFYAATSSAKNILKSNQPNLSADLGDTRLATGSSVNRDMPQHIKLPIIELPKFDGNCDSWLEFRDVFESLIHSNDSVSDIQRFHYLRSSLVGGARQVIASLEMSSANYVVAWDLVCGRYNNSRVLIQTHVKALFSLGTLYDESSQTLRGMIDNIRKHMRALNSLNEPTDNWDTLIIYIVTTKLDTATNRDWEQKRSSLAVANLESLLSFLRDRADLLESLDHNKIKPRNSNNYNKTNIKTRSFVTARENISGGCPYCKGDHNIKGCREFLKLRVGERIGCVKHLRLCLNCLRSGHFVGDCRSGSCQRCQSRHHSLLHIGNDEYTPTRSVAQPAPHSPEESINLATSHFPTGAQVLLSTVSIYIFDRDNKRHMIRALLDPGSQSSFVTSDLCNILQLPKSKTNITVASINEKQSEINYSSSVVIQSGCNSFSTRITCLVIPHIASNLPSFSVDRSNIQIPAHLKLADPKFNIPGKIDLLLGADCFWQFLCVGQIRTLRGPVLQNTKFGWIVSGPIQSCAVPRTHCNFTRESESQIDKQISRFWEIETFPNTKPLSQIEKQCETHFINNFKRHTNGKFIVSIPLSHAPDKLGDSYKTAERRLMSLERKFERFPKFRDDYFQFIREYENLGHMSKIRDQNSAQVSYYLPHHGVVNQSSITTRLRVVFDASCPTTTGYSLNDLQMVGPTIQPDLFSALIRYRKYNYVVASDIEKMYRMCLINPEQRSLQRILWRENPSDPIESYELSTVTYGTSSASYLAIRCLQQLGIECGDPVVSNIIRNHFYVDDLLTGGDTVAEVTLAAHKVSRVLRRGGFILRKWLSNSPEILRGIYDQERIDLLDLGANENTKTLGLLWNAKSDCLTYKINGSTRQRVTKRLILSEVSQIFDPLGLLSPVIISAKMLLQELWGEKLDWDDSLPNHLFTKWMVFRDDLSSLNDLRVSRQVVCKDPVGLELHGFSDSSSHAYGACIYLKSHDKSGNVRVGLVCSKSKVAPLNSQTIPRLELMAALLLTELMSKVELSLDISLDKITYWCDSTIVLGWLNTPPNILQVFVANRVARICELSNARQWRHVPTNDNPADFVSRGVKPSALCKLETYWYGPCWLKGSESDYPPTHSPEKDIPELRKRVETHNIALVPSAIAIADYSSLTRLQRIIAYCLRFKGNCLPPAKSRIIGPLQTIELNRAMTCLIRVSQIESFPGEVADLTANRPLKAKGRMTKLNPFLDNHGVLRVGGRLANSEFNFDKKFPILLSSKHNLTKLLFEREHKSLLHAGPQHLLASIRDRFWPISGRNLARRVVHNCVSCFRAKPHTIAPIMGNLPSGRVKPAPPFHTTGVDYAGPFLIKSKLGRGGNKTKCYVSLFVCFVTKAVHLELVSDLTTESFIAALRRFVGRRGKPSRIFSDNGTCFVGANRGLKELGAFLFSNSDKLTVVMEGEGIRWSFIPAGSPHFGGLWESGVKSMKHHLKRVAGNVALTFEQFCTLLIQIEAVLNSRPLTPLSPDPSDLTPLTPSHFLIGRPMTAVADPDLKNVPNNRLTHYQHIQHMQQHFWSRWSREYVSELQHRTKWATQHGSLQIDDLVLIKEDNQPSLKWALGRIVEIHPGKDGVARVASIRTPTGVIRRAFSKICPLPLQD